ncbi:GNAT family N-acetyltransferase [Williamsia sterculiae]|uniref:N-acetyltransferase domain-containing protein n=1 Tax=Williamsia sterculiae TaxID=1344003 RepID=A0A1N7E336_9NOCA|nr:GNAT family N-acetyltransferase [Williamsia sterculiae]SIR82493.1 hypothetical protein SAMN05445060_1134 [Williamsia sterculiae]
MTDDRFDVQDRPDESRYVLIDTEADDAVIGEEVYTDLDGARPVRILVHTGVSEAYGSQGLASLLVRHVIDDVIGGGRDIVPVCPYVVGWLSRHPEYDGHVVEATGEHRDAATSRRRSS